MGIKINNQSIAKLYLGNIAVKRAYSNNAIVYDTGGNLPCFEVVYNLSGATGHYVDVYVITEEKWYKKNNLNQFEEYGIMPEVADLSTLTYYVGKLALCTTDHHEYKWNGSQWVDLGAMISPYQDYNIFEELELTQNMTSSSGTGIDTGYNIGGSISKIWVKYYLKTHNSDFALMQNGAYALRSGVAVNYFGSLNAAGGNYYINGTDKFRNDAWSFTGNDYAELTYDRDAHTLTFNGDTKTFTAGADSASGYTLKIYNGVKGVSTYSMYQGEKLYGFKVWGNDGNLACDMVPAQRKSDSKFGVYDKVRNVFCEAVGMPMTGNIPVENLPEEYDTKVAPANNVHYNTLAELEVMECPWNGMQATIGSNYDLYFYWNNHWTQIQNLPCYEVVDTITDATGTYVDVYATDTEKWYKRNNLSQYEEYGIMPSVADLSTLTYYVGKLALCTTDMHEYKWNGSQWIDLGACTDVYTEYEYTQGNGTSYIITDYIPRSNSKIEIDIEGYTNAGAVFGTNELRNGSQCQQSFKILYTSSNIRFDYGTRNYSSTSSLKNTRGVIKMNPAGGYHNTTQLVAFDSGGGSQLDNCTVHCGIFCFVDKELTSADPEFASIYTKYNGKIYSVRIYEGDTLVRNYVPAIKDGNVGFFETINHVMWDSDVSTPFTVGGSSESHGSVPEDYDTKVAPSNNVHYNTLIELELMECPWNGMQATVGANYDLYFYWNNHWNPIGSPCFEVVSSLSEASGDYIDVYDRTSSIWYKKNNLDQYEEYGLLPTVDNLSDVTYYVGKMVLLSTDLHEYKWNGDQWVDLGIATDVYMKYEYMTCNGTSYIITDYIPNDNTAAEIDISGLTGGYQVFGALNYWSSNGSAAKRLRIQGAGSGQIRYDRGANSVYVYQSVLSNRMYLRNDSTGGYRDGSKIANYSSSTEVTGCQAPLGICTAVCYDFDTSRIILQPGISHYNGKIYSMKIYEGDTLVRNFVPAIKDNAVGLYDTVNKVLWDSEVSTQFTVGGSSEQKGTVPEDYTQKTAPANNVHYNTLIELFISECPWVGMEATVGEDYIPYIYTENGWIISDFPLDLPYLRFDPTADTTFKFTGQGLKYSIDGGYWRRMNQNEPTLTIEAGHYILLKGEAYVTQGSAIGKFSSSNNVTFKVSGNIMSLIHDDNFVGVTTLSGKPNVFNALFNKSKVNDVSELVLPSLDVPYRGYEAMFWECGSLTKAMPRLVATTVDSYGYSTMFCETAITQAPELDVTTLTSSNGGQNLANMFIRCRSLVIPPTVLKPTTLKNQCYYYMFEDTPIRETPFIAAETFSGRYNGDCLRMFSRATNLIRCCAMFTSAPNSSNTSSWFNGITTTGTFYKNSNATWDQTITKGDSTVPTKWNITDWGGSNYLTFTVVEDSGSTFKFSKAGLEYSIDNGAWTTLPANTNTPLVAKDHNIRFRGYLTPDGTADGKLGLFSSSGRYNASGHICTLMYGDYYYGQTGKIKARTFQTLFQSSKIVDASALILPTVNGDYMYYAMFKGSTYMVTPPAINFTGASYYGCLEMFYGCSSMTTVPSVTFGGEYLNTGSLQRMFQGCSSIVDASPIILNARIAWDSLTDTFRGCSSLQTTPIMKGNISQNGANRTFDGCSSLTTITYLGTTKPNSSNSPGWLPSGCTATFYMNQNATWDSTVTRDSDGVPSGCTITKIDPTSV